MKVLEVKNNLVKIEYNQEDNLLLSGFVIIEDVQCPYVAQVLSLKADNGINYAIVKLLFTFNDEGILKNYNGTIPSLDAEVTRLDANDLLDILPVNTPLEIGTIAHQGIDLKVDMSIFEKNLVICSDNSEDSNILTENFIYQLTENNSKSILFDADGTFAGQKLVFGKDFKLPLNYETINYIYDHDLGNIDSASKAIIQDIFLEVQEYSKTVLDKFIPFDTFLDVVDQQYRALGIPELVLLKNKLLKYKEMNVFAQSPKEIQILRSIIRANLTNTLDISGIEDSLQGEIIKYVYNTIDEMDLFVYSFVQLNNENADKKLIRHFFTKNKIYTSTICSHNFKYLFELKERASNLILFAPQVMQHDFNAYNTFLNKLNPDEFIIYGKATQNIPLIVELASMLEEPEPEEGYEAQEEGAEEETEVQPKQDDFSEESNSYSYETLIEDTAVSPEPKDSEEEITQESQESQESQEPQEPQEQKNVQEETAEPEEPAETESDEESEEEEAEEEAQPEETEPIEDEEQEEETNDSEDSEDEPDESEDTEEDTEEESEDESEDEEQDEVDTETISNIIDKEIEAEIYTDPDNEEIIEGEFQEINEETPVIESSIEDTPMELPPIESLSEELATDTIIEEESSIVTQDENTDIAAGETIIEEEPQNEELTEDDLNFIQDVNSPVEEGSLPVYPAETVAENADIPAFTAGDHVSHPKYGEGIVEKLIRYGSKSLCSINFINVGRRLLDPAISEITKL